MINVSDFIVTESNAIPEDICDSVISSFEDALQNKALCFQRGEQDNQRKIRKDIAIRLKLVNPELDEEVKRILVSFAKKYVDKYPTLAESDFCVSEVKVQKTDPKQGFHAFHKEAGRADPEAQSRILVYTGYLNSVEVGGETEFLYCSEKISPVKGNLCIFPSGFTHTHRGNPPYSGSKYIITGWFYDISS